MINPEVWDFKPPQHHFSTVTRDCKRNDVPTVVSTHYFNHSVSLVLPNTVSIPDEMRTCISDDSDYYRINAVNVCDLINKEFIEAFIKKGELSLLTIGKRIDLDNSIAITPTGQLIISLLTEDFQKLGLEGKTSFFDRKIHTRYESFTPGKKNYEHTRESLKERLEQSFDVIVAWDAPDERICPSSIAAWFHDRGYSISVCRQTFSQRTECTLKIPVLMDGTDYDKFFEWLGVFTIVGDVHNQKEDDYVNTYVCPPPFIDVGQVQHLQWTGFFTRKQAGKIYKAMKEYVSQRETLPWTALHVLGFSDSPVSWDLKQHTFFSDGDNSYSILFRPLAASIIRKSLSSNNKPRIIQ